MFSEADPVPRYHLQVSNAQGRPEDGRTGESNQGALKRSGQRIRTFQKDMPGVNPLTLVASHAATKWFLPSVTSGLERSVLESSCCTRCFTNAHQGSWASLLLTALATFSLAYIQEHIAAVTASAVSFCAAPIRELCDSVSPRLCLAWT